MAKRGASRWRTVAHLLLLSRLPVRVGLAVVVVVATFCVVAGVLTLNVQRHFVSAADGGRLSTLLAQGSTGLTAWEGWAAAAFFLVAVLRLRSGAPEPPASRHALETLSISDIRAGLVREYTWVRVGLVLLYAVGLGDGARALRYGVAAAGGDAVASASLAATVIEAAGLIAAAASLTVWALTFRQQLLRLGAVD